MLYKYPESSISVLGGKPCIKGTGMSVQILLEWMADSAASEILEIYPRISLAAFQEAMRFAAGQMNNDFYRNSGKQPDASELIRLADWLSAKIYLHVYNRFLGKVSK